MQPLFLSSGILSIKSRTTKWQIGKPFSCRTHYKRFTNYHRYFSLLSIVIKPPYYKVEAGVRSRGKLIYIVITLLLHCQPWKKPFGIQITKTADRECRLCFVYLLLFLRINKKSKRQTKKLTLLERKLWLRRKKIIMECVNFGEVFELWKDRPLLKDFVIVTKRNTKVALARH